MGSVLRQYRLSESQRTSGQEGLSGGRGGDNHNHEEEEEQEEEQDQDADDGAGADQNGIDGHDQEAGHGTGIDRWHRTKPTQRTQSRKQAVETDAARVAFREPLQASSRRNADPAGQQEHDQGEPDEDHRTHQHLRNQSLALLPQLLFPLSCPSPASLTSLQQQAQSQSAPATPQPTRREQFHVHLPRL